MIVAEDCNEGWIENLLDCLYGYHDLLLGRIYSERFIICDLNLVNIFNHVVGITEAASRETYLMNNALWGANQIDIASSFSE